MILQPSSLVENQRLQHTNLLFVLLFAGKHQCSISRASFSCTICKKMLWGLQKTEKCHLSSTVQEKLRSHTELQTKLLLSNSGVWLGERFKLVHVLREQLLTPNYTNSTHLAIAALQGKLLHKLFLTNSSEGFLAMAVQYRL